MSTGVRVRSLIFEGRRPSGPCRRRHAQGQRLAGHADPVCRRRSECVPSRSGYAATTANRRQGGPGLRYLLWILATSTWPASFDRQSWSPPPTSPSWSATPPPRSTWASTAIPPPSTAAPTTTSALPPTPSTPTPRLGHHHPRGSLGRRFRGLLGHRRRRPGSCPHYEPPASHLPRPFEHVRWTQRSARSPKCWLAVRGPRTALPHLLSIVPERGVGRRLTSVTSGPRTHGDLWNDNTRQHQRGHK